MSDLQAMGMRGRELRVFPLQYLFASLSHSLAMARVTLPATCTPACSHRCMAPDISLTETSTLVSRVTLYPLPQ